MTVDELILTHILGISRSQYYLHQPKLTKQQEVLFESYKARYVKGEPLQYILGVANFMGLDFKVNPHVLIPRPETECLVELAIKAFKGKRILDIGSGSGCIAITLAKNLPLAKVVSIDVSKEAIELARENAVLNKVSNVEFIECSLDQFKNNEVFDLVISNPPYIPTADLTKLPADVRQEPILALDGGGDGLDFYRRIIKIIPGLIHKGACLMMEFGDGQEKPIKSILESQQIFSEIQIHKDLTGRNRFVLAK